jgi:hypothetical protein
MYTIYQKKKKKKKRIEGGSRPYIPFFFFL